MGTSTYLITGATGFLGRSLLQEIARVDPQSRQLALARHKKTWDDYAWTRDLHNVQVIEASVTDPTFSGRDMDELDGIFHLAAVVRHSREDSRELYETNVEGTLNMVRLAAKKGCRMIFVSTSGTVGVFRKPDEWADELAPYQTQRIENWPYYHSKLQAELKARKLADELGVDLVIIRPPILLGPEDHRFRSTGHIIRYMRQKLPFLIKGGIHFVDIRDVTPALVQAMRIEHPQPVYHLSGTACSIDAFFQMVGEASGVSGPWLKLPYGLALTVARTVKGIAAVLPGVKESPLPDPVVFEMAGCYWDVRSRYAANDLGFLNRNARDTIQDTVVWLREHHEALRAA